MSEAPDATEDFDTEFAAARDAEREAAPEVNDEAHVEGEADGEEGAQAREPVETEAEKVTKRLRDTQRAMKAERAKRQELEQRLAKLEEAPARANAPLTPEVLLAKLRGDDDDPIGDLQTMKELAKLLVGQTTEETAADQQARQRAQALTTVSNAMKEYESDFKELNPDYDKAAQHFMNARMEELKDTGLDGQALAAAMQNDFAGIVSRSIAAGKDPAEIIYNMAARRGFKPGAAGAKLETIERGQAASKTLTGGGASQGTLSAGKVADLKGAAFDAAFDKLRAAERRRG